MHLQDNRSNHIVALPLEHASIKGTILDFVRFVEKFVDLRDLAR
jgi:hypothetical protein